MRKQPQKHKKKTFSHNSLFGSVNFFFCRPVWECARQPPGVSPARRVCNPSATGIRVSHESSRALQNESKYTEKRLRQADGSDWKSSLKWKHILLCSDADSPYLCLSFIIPVCRVCCLQLPVNLLAKFEFEVFLTCQKQRVPVQRDVCALAAIM